MYVFGRKIGLFWVNKMQPQTLYELVNLWRETNTNDQKPSFFLSQKLTESQEDKVCYVDSYTPLDYSECVPSRIFSRDMILHSTKMTVDTTSNSFKLHTYKTIPSENKADFKLKPLKSRFTGIPGPYKN